MNRSYRSMRRRPSYVRESETQMIERWPRSQRCSLDVADDDDAVGVRALEHRAVRQGEIRAVVDVAQEQPILALAGRLVDPPQDLDVERVGDVAGDDAQERAPTAAQAAGEHVGLVAQLRCDGQDALTGVVSDGDARFAAVEDARDGRDRDPGTACDVAQRDGRRPVLGVLHESRRSFPIPS
jgi:hypothetical protein